MDLPNIWGQGALFCFSGLDGECQYHQSFACTLLADHLGVRIHTPELIDLYISVNNIKDVHYKIVASDIIIAELTTADNEKYNTSFVFYNQNTIIGLCRKNSLHLNPVDSSFTCKTSGNYKVYSGTKSTVYLSETEAKEYTCFSVSTAKNNINIPKAVDETIETKLQFYKNLPELRIKDPKISRTFYKCISVMKSQVYSAEGQFKHFWTTPDKLPHKNLWLWDSVFHSLGNRFIDKNLARDSLLSVLDTQKPDGLIPHMSTPYCSSNITQPPVLAWGFWEYYKNTSDISILKKAYPKLESYLKWNLKNRRCESGLFQWHINTEDKNCRCDESGMDNSPRFDHAVSMECIDFSCFMVTEAESMAKICKSINEERCQYWERFAADLKNSINKYLWDETDAFYFDRITSDKTFQKTKSVASFLPLFAGVCDETKAQKLVESLNNIKTFKDSFNIPSISKEDPTFGTDMWRGPVWINYNYFISCGLKRYGYVKEADSIIQKTLTEIAKYYHYDGTVYEFYDSACQKSPSKLMRKGEVIEPYNIYTRMQTIRDYGWTAALFVHMLLENLGLFE